jgi:hypothetical protein
MDLRDGMYFKALRMMVHSDERTLLQSAINSPYRWWYESLRCSQDYWWVCQQNGKTYDSDLRKVWENFGDVFAFNFPRWWVLHGVDIFKEKVAPPAIRIVESSNENLKINREFITLRVPTNISRRSLFKQFREIVDSLGEIRVRQGDSAFPLDKVKRVRIDIYETALRVFHYRNLINFQNQSGFDAGIKDLSLYEIGSLFNVSPAHKRKAGESIDSRILKERVMRVAVIRMTKRAEQLISNAEVGCFPSYIPREANKRWTKAQISQRDDALISGAFANLGISDVNTLEIDRVIEDRREFIKRTFGSRR